MGLKTNHEAIRGVRSKKGVISGCGVTSNGSTTLTMAAGRVKFGIMDADITAKDGQMLNEGGAEKDVVQATFDVSAHSLDEGKYLLYLKTNGALDHVAEAETALTAGPMMAINVAGTNPLALKLDTPSIRLCQFIVDADGNVSDTVGIEYTLRENA